jgi:hypothetical protein
MPRRFVTQRENCPKRCIIFADSTALNLVSTSVSRLQLRAALPDTRDLSSKTSASAYGHARWLRNTAETGGLQARFSAPGLIKPETTW